MLGSSRTPLGGTRPKSHQAQQARDELINGRYNLTHPTAVYPLDSNAPNGKQRFPDFQPWKHSIDEDLIAESHLQKGFFEAPHVGNELLSARNIMHQLLRSENSLDELSSNLLKSINVHTLNTKIGPGSYKPPPRVTLTDQKREAWLRDLSQEDVPLRKLARTIPHGIRNKPLLDQCLSKNIPINRAIWLVRCVGTNELRQLKRKGGANIEIQWVQEWTRQVLEFIEKLSQDYLNFESFHRATVSWKQNISYMLRFVSNLYIENLIDQDIFKGWIIKFFRACKTFELPLSLTLLKMFWSDICKTDYLVKEVTESLIVRYENISTMKSLLSSADITVTDSKLNEETKQELLQQFKSLIVDSFNQSVDNFVLPSNWRQLEPTLKTLLNLNDPLISKRFELISYRNQSLMINYSLDKDVSYKDIVTLFDSLGTTTTTSDVVGAMLTGDWRINVNHMLRWTITKYRHDYSRIFFTADVLKKMKSGSQISSKDMEIEILSFVLDVPHLLSQIVLKNLFLLLNELSRLKLFKVSTYMRRLISSGLIYQTNNATEKQIHASILKNLRPQKSSQAVMILKNLETEKDKLGYNPEEKLKAASNLLNGLEDFFTDTEKVSYLEGLDVGLKLEVSDAYISGLLANENLFPLLTFKEFHRIVKTELFLHDLRGLFTFVMKGLESKTLEEAVVLLICDIFTTFKRVVKNITQWDAMCRLLVDNAIMMDSLKCLKKVSALLKGDPLAESLYEETESLVKAKSTHLDTVAITNTLLESGVSLQTDQLLQESNLNHCFQVLIRAFFTDNEAQRSKSAILFLLNVLKDLHTTEFNRALFVYIKKTYSNPAELFKHEPLVDLVVTDLLQLETLATMFIGFRSTVHTGIVLDVLFKDLTQTTSPEHLKLELLRSRVKVESPSLILNLFKESLAESDQKLDSLQSDSAEIISKLLPENKSNNYRSELFTCFIDILVHDRALVVTMLESLDLNSRDVLVDLLIGAITSNTDRIDTDEAGNSYSQLADLVKKLDRFNLEVFQVLLRLKLNSSTSSQELLSSLEQIITESTNKEKFFGSMFELLDASLKTKLLHQFEAMFLSSPTFPSVVQNNQVVSLEVLTDTLITLSRGCEVVPLPDEMLFSLDVSLESLIRVVSQTENSFDDLHTAIALFLKILIIHKTSLINVVIERNTIKESFLNNLVNLLSTKIVSQNLQLKNLLYDLILSIKASVNELNSSQSTMVKLPLSIMNLPAISPADNTHASTSQLKQNLHDFSITQNLYLLSKMPPAYHEMHLKPFDLVEDSNVVENMNDTAIGLQLFEAAMEKRNPS